MKLFTSDIVPPMIRWAKKEVIIDPVESTIQIDGFIYIKLTDAILQIVVVKPNVFEGNRFNFNINSEEELQTAIYTVENEIKLNK